MRPNLAVDQLSGGIAAACPLGRLPRHSSADPRQTVIEVEQATTFKRPLTGPTHQTP